MKKKQVGDCKTGKKIQEEMVSMWRRRSTFKPAKSGHFQIGADKALKISAISIAVAVPVAINTRQGIVNIPQAWWEVAQVYRFTRWQTLVKVLLPAAAPSLFNGWRQAVMQAWLTLVFVELLASSEGIGYLMVWGRQLAQLDLVMLGMLLIGLIGVALDASLRLLETRLQRWRVAAF
jgi:sulfonate transport system permease protein